MHLLFTHLLRIARLLKLGEQPNLFRSASNGSRVRAQSVSFFSKLPLPRAKVGARQSRPGPLSQPWVNVLSSPTRGSILQVRSSFCVLQRYISRDGETLRPESERHVFPTCPVRPSRSRGSQIANRRLGHLAHSS